MAKMTIAGSIQNTRNNVTDADGYALPPLAANLKEGQIAVNTCETDPCIFFKTSEGKIVKIVSEEKLTKALTDILGNSAADLDTLRELIAQFEGSANDILPMLTALTDRVTAAETSLTSKADKSALNAHTGNTSNPHSVTKAQVGLSNVDNTADSAKPVSTAQATAIADAKKAGTDAQTSLTSHVDNKANPHGVNAAQVGALAVDGTAEDSKKLGGVNAAHFIFGSSSGGSINASAFNFDAPVKSGFFRVDSDNTSVGLPNNGTGWGLHINWSANNAAGTTLFSPDTTNTPLMIRTRTGSGGGIWRTMYDSGNSNLPTVDWAAKDISVENRVNLSPNKPALYFKSTATGAFNSAIGLDTNSTECLGFVSKHIATRYKFITGLNPDSLINGSLVNYENAAFEISDSGCLIKGSTVWHAGNNLIAYPNNTNVDSINSALWCSSMYTTGEGVPSHLNYSQVYQLGASYGGAGLQFAQTYGGGNSNLKFRTKSDTPNSHWNDWFSVYHSGNSNLNTVNWACKNLNIPYGGSITDSTYNRRLLEIGFTEGVGDHFILSTTGSDPRVSRLKGICNGSLTWDGNTIYHAGNSNKSDVNWTAANLYAANVNSNNFINSGTNITTFVGIGDNDIKEIRLANASFSSGIGSKGGHFFITTNGGNASPFWAVGDRIGIGTEAPTERLTVNGKIKLLFGSEGIDTSVCEVLSMQFADDSGTQDSGNRRHSITQSITAGSPSLNFVAINVFGGTGENTNPSEVIRFRGDGSTVTKRDLIVGGGNDYNLYTRHIKGKHWTSDVVDKLFLQYNENQHTIINAGTSTGFVGVGNENPTERLDVNGNGKFSGNTYVNGNAGFGTNNPTDRVHAIGNIRATEKGIFGGNVESNGSGIFTGDIIAKKSGAVTFSTSDAAAGATRLNDLVDVKLPTNLANKMVLAYDPAQVNSDGSKGGYTFMPSAGTGTGKVSSTEIASLPDHNHNDIVYASDERLKENVIPLRNATIMLNNLRPKEYNWNETGKKLGLRDPKAYGLIAQEVEGLREIIDLVKPMHGGESGYLGVDYVKLVPVLIAGFQEQHKEIIALNQKLKTIQARANKAYGNETNNADKIAQLEADNSAMRAEIEELKMLIKK